MKSYIGVVAAISILFQSLQQSNARQGSIYHCIFIFLLPSFLAVIAAVARKKTFMIVCFIWMLPGTLYLSVAVIP